MRSFLIPVFSLSTRKIINWCAVNHAQTVDKWTCQVKELIKSWISNWDTFNYPSPLYWDNLLMSDKVDDILVMAGEANNRMSRYFVIVTCRNSQSEIENALLSLQNQTIQPSFVIVIDDGSTDKTPAVLRKLQESWPSLYVMTNPDLGYDIGRVVNNWNLAITFARLYSNLSFSTWTSATL